MKVFSRKIQAITLLLATTASLLFTIKTHYEASRSMDAQYIGNLRHSQAEPVATATTAPSVKLRKEADNVSLPSESDVAPVRSEQVSKPQSVVNEAWCPGAACSNSALCRPCQQRFLFILSTGRAASTTLLGMINYLPNVRLAGENWNTLYIASLLEKNLLERGFANFRTKVPAKDGAWFHHSIPKQSMACTIQKVLQTINPPPEEVQQQIIRDESSGALALDGYDASQIVGAKMIRIQNGEWKPSEAAEFFKYNFPCAKYIVNTRLDKEAQAASQLRYWSNSTLEEIVDKSKRDHGFLSEFVQHMDAHQARLIYMEDWAKNVTHLNEVVEWLGFRNCQYDKVLHNNANGYEQDKSLLEVGVGCQAPIGF